MFNALFKSMRHVGIENFNLVNRLTCNTPVKKMVKKTKLTNLSYHYQSSDFEP